MRQCHIVVTEAPGAEPIRYDYESHALALVDVCRIFETGHPTVIVQIYQGTIADRGDADPVQVFG